MKKSLFSLSCAISLVTLLASTAGATVLYQNTNTYANILFNDGQSEFGNEVVMAGNGPFTVTNFVFEYYSLSSSVGEAEVRIYENNGTLSSGYATPNTPLFDSGQFAISPTGTNGETLDFNAQNTPGFDFIATNDITWTVQYSGTGTNAGIEVFYPPTVGTNYGDIWVNNGSSGWSLMEVTNAPLGGGAEIDGTTTPVPEPTAVMLGLAGGVAGLLMVLRGRRS
jgi:hypothetical protein